MALNFQPCGMKGYIMSLSRELASSIESNLKQYSAFSTFPDPAAAKFAHAAEDAVAEKIRAEVTRIANLPKPSSRETKPGSKRDALNTLGMLIEQAASGLTPDDRMSGADVASEYAVKNAEILSS